MAEGAMMAHEGSGGYLREALILAFPSSVPPGDRHIMTLSAYFDESGTHRESATVTVAGYISTQEKWIAFEEEWVSALRDFGIPFFHASDFNNGAPPYYHEWTADEKRIRYYRLVEIIRRHTYGSVGTTVDKERFKTLVSPRAARTAGGAYGIAVHGSLLATARMVRECSPGGMVSFIMDRLAKGGGELLRQYRENERSPSVREALRFNSLRFEDKDKFVPIQAADILAYELNRQALRRRSVIYQYPRDNLRVLVFGDMDWAMIDDQELETFETVASKKGEILALDLEMKQRRRKRQQIRPSVLDPEISA